MIGKDGNCSLKNKQTMDIWTKKGLKAECV